MAKLIRPMKFFSVKYFQPLGNRIIFKCSSSSSVTPTESSPEDEEFRTLDLRGKRPDGRIRRKPRKPDMLLPPRSEQLPVDKEWSDVWPGPRSFHPATVPLPLRQGFVEKGAPPGKYANAELMKIPNFLHLTPPAIKKHCAVLKQFCTPWPKGLDTDEAIEKHFPLEVISSDYCHSSPTIRDPAARIVTFRVKLSTLTLDYHARDKLLRLVGDKYNPKTDVLTLVAERCPLKKQNYDYLQYLLTALFCESWKTEDWEEGKEVSDMELYVWSGSPSQKTITSILEKYREANRLSPSLQQVNDFTLAEELLKVPEMSSVAKYITDLHNQGEDEYTISKYKESVKVLLGLPAKQEVQGESV